MTDIRLFCKDKLAVGKAISTDKSHYLVNVMRRKIGDNVLLVNGKDGEFLSQISNINKKAVILKIAEKLKDYQEPQHLGLIFAPIKKIDLLAKSATELGTTVFLPFKSQHDQCHFKIEQLQSNIIEAVEQSERLDMPSIEKQQELKTILENIEKSGDSLVLFCEERSGENNIGKVLQNNDLNHIYILVGAEGGFSEEEKQLIKSFSCVKSISLGDRILRTETAVAVACGLVQSWRNELF